MEGKDVFQPEFDGEFLSKEINSAFDNLPLRIGADSNGITGELVRTMKLRALLLSLLNQVWENGNVPKLGVGVHSQPLQSWRIC